MTRAAGREGNAAKEGIPSPRPSPRGGGVEMTRHGSIPKITIQFRPFLLFSGPRSAIIIPIQVPEGIS